MQRWRTIIGVAPLVALALAACNPARNDQQTRREVTEFAAKVATGITHDGPTVWHRFFRETPEFFMASDGLLAFPDGTSASKGIDQLLGVIHQIELKWSDLRIDPLGPGLASMGARFHETQTMSDGSTLIEDGYFTGIVEQRNGQWQFRNAHWSTPKPAK